MSMTRQSDGGDSPSFVGACPPVYLYSDAQMPRSVKTAPAVLTDLPMGSGDSPHVVGLGAVWTGVFPGEERIAAVREILAIPDGYAPLNVIPIGYPAEDPAVKNKWNPAKIHADRW